MKYRVDFVWNNGDYDCFIAENAAERDFNIADMLRRGEFKMIQYCRLYANGETGIDIVVMDERPESFDGYDSEYAYLGF